MRWGRVGIAGRDCFGIIEDDYLLVHRGDLFSAPAPTGERLALAECRWLTPCQPGKMLALWNNFHQAATRNGWPIPAEPLYLAKTPNSFSAHQAVVSPPPHYDGRVTYEGELGVVIGRHCYNISEQEAAAAIFGYCCVNDITALDLIGRDPGFPQWVRAKSCDGFGAFGPVIATDIDPLALSLCTLVNGRERQNYRLDDMIFKPAALVSLLSREISLEPGDVIACGTSLGVLPMRPGSVVEVVIDGIGSLTTRFDSER